MEKNNTRVQQISDTLTQDIDSEELLICAFPTIIENTHQAVDSILHKTFSITQAFVQKRMRKKSGKILFLIAAQASGMEYANSELNNDKILNYTLQGGLIGLSKTITKEYGKKNIQANTLYIDWNTINIDNLASHIVNMPSELSGQVYALDHGVFV